MVFGGYGELTGGLGVLGGSSVGLLYPCMVLFAALEVLYDTRFGSKHYILVQLANVYYVGIAGPFVAHWSPSGAPKQPLHEQNEPF